MFGTDNLNTSTPSLAEALQSAKVRTEAFKLRKNQAYDQTHHPLNLNFSDLVKRRIPSNRPDIEKLTPKYKGPYAVTKLRRPVDVMITDRKPDLTPFQSQFSRDPVPIQSTWELGSSGCDGRLDGSLDTVVRLGLVSLESFRTHCVT